MPDCTGPRIDHLVWAAFPENIDSHIRLLSALFGIDFEEPPDAPSAGSGTRIVVSLAEGVEFVAPADPNSPMSAGLAAALDAKGESPFAWAIRVPSITETAERAKAAGHKIGPNLLSDDTEARRGWVASWDPRILDLFEHPVEADIPGPMMMVIEYEFTAEPTAYVDRVGRLDRVALLVDPANAERCVRLFGELFDLRFDGDAAGEDDILSYVSWNGGLEVIAPTGTSSPLAAELTERLGRTGEGLYSAAYAVEDLAATVTKARDLGLSPSAEVRRRNGALESVLTDLAGLRLIASEPARRGPTGTV
jgi:hypothetical protein